MRVLKLKYYAIWTLSTQLMIINGVTLKGSPRPCDVHVLFDLGVLAVVVVVVRWCWRTILLLLLLLPCCPALTLPIAAPA